MWWKTTVENVGKETGAKFTACTAVKLSTSHSFCWKYEPKSSSGSSCLPLRVCLNKIVPECHVVTLTRKSSLHTVQFLTACGMSLYTEINTLTSFVLQMGIDHSVDFKWSRDSAAFRKYLVSPVKLSPLLPSHLTSRREQRSYLKRNAKGNCGFLDSSSEGPYVR